MADTPFAPVSPDDENRRAEQNECTEAVCIDANRIYDSCADKDCLTDLRVFFTDSTQAMINNAVNVRIRDADVISVCIDLEPVPFHRGFYSVDMTFFFDICLDVFMAPGAIPNTANGLSIYSKRVILYGSEGNVKVFSSDLSFDELDAQNAPVRNLPKATVQVAKPMALSAKLKDCCGNCSPPCRIPECISRHFGDSITPPDKKCVYATIGVFTIVQIERNVQLLVPSYDYCIPSKECVTSSDSPCEMFGRIDFPTNEFFPPKAGEIQDDYGCGCNYGCHHKK